MAVEKSIGGLPPSGSTSGVVPVMWLWQNRAVKLLRLRPLQENHSTGKPTNGNT